MKRKNGNDIIFVEQTEEQAKQEALRFIMVRLRTQREVEQQLTKKGYSKQQIIRVIAFLKEYQYLDDAVYCRSWIFDRIQFHPCGRQKMIFELSKKVSDIALVQQSLEQYFPLEQELELARIAAQKKKNSMHGTMRREQMGRFLYNKGYNGEVIQTVLREISWINQEEVWEE